MCMHAKSLQSCSIFCDPMDYSPPGSSAHGILQARILEWVAMPSSSGSFWPGIELTSLMSPALSGGCLTTSASWEAPDHIETGIPGHHTCLLRNLYAGQESRVRTGLGTMDWFQIGKRVCRGDILSPCLFNYMQITSCEMLGWMKHKLEQRLPGEISITSDMQMTPPLWRKEKN